MTETRRLTLGPTEIEQVEMVCERFEAACRAGRRPRIEHELAGAAGTIRATLLGELLSIEVSYRLRHGERPTPEEYLTRFSDDADVVVAACEQAIPADRPGGPDHPGGETSTIPESEGHILVSSASFGSVRNERYTLTRLHARGGIGEVWLARDAEMGREVALKELRAEQVANPAVRNRFLEEAKITGQLEHPGIVPVYELAHRPQDRAPFYTMRFVRGRTLTEAVRAYHTLRRAGGAGPLDLMALLNAFLGVCNAVAYAHSRGVIHRDLKGQNVVLGDFGEVMVLDWGLAKLVDRPEPAAVDEAHPPVALAGDPVRDPTELGQALGTPSYMAPEQAEGRLDQVGPRTDVYGLGAMLYELLSGLAPFTGPDTREVLRRVREEEPAPPRRINPGAPAALEAVSLKALAKIPSQRYDSAWELARDVQRWLADEPVSAYREPLPSRVRRWVKRHRTPVTGLAAAAGVALVSLTVGVVLLTAANARERQARQEATTKGLEAASQRDRALANFRMAREAVDSFLTKVGEDERLKATALEHLRRELLETARRFYDRFVEQEQADVGLQAERGRAYLRLATLTGFLGADAEALALDGQAVAIFDALNRDHPGEPAYLADLADAKGSAGAYEFALSRAREAKSKIREALEITERLARDDPEDPRHLAARGSFQTLLGGISDVTGELDEAESHFRSALEISRRLGHADPANVKHASDEAKTLHALGFIGLRRSRPADAEVAFGGAIRITEPIARAHPERLNDRVILADSHYRLGWSDFQSGRRAEAEAHYRAAVNQFRALADEHPDVPRYRAGLGSAQKALAQSLAATGQTREVEEAYRAAIAILARLVETSPDGVEHVSELAGSHALFGWFLYTCGRHKEAEAEMRLGVDGYRRAVAKQPQVVWFRQTQAHAYNNLGVILDALARYDESLAAYRESLAIRERLVREHPDQPQNWSDLAQSHSNLGASYDRDGRYDEAARSSREAMKIRARLTHDHPETVRYRSDLADSYHIMAWSEWRAGRPGEAEAAHRESLAIRERLAREHADQPEYWSDLARSHNILGVFYAQCARYDESAQSYGEAMKIAARLARDHPELVRHQSELAASYDNLASTQRRAGRLREAEAAYRESLAVRERLVRAHPEVSEYAYDLADEQAKLGRHYRHLGRPAQAEETNRAAEDLWARLANDHPGNRHYAVLRGALRSNLGYLMLYLDRPGEAVARSDEAIAILRGALEKEPSLRQAKGYLAQAQLVRARGLDRQGRPRDAVAAWDRAIALSGPQPAPMYQLLRAASLARAGDIRAALDAVETSGGGSISPGDDFFRARARAQIVAAILRDGQLGERKRRSMAEHQATLALTDLASARTASLFHDPQHREDLRTDPDLDPLRTRAEFRLILLDVEFPSDPFTSAD
jgi:serine/threonine-protein kinase